MRPTREVRRRAKRRETALARTYNHGRAFHQADGPSAYRRRSVPVPLWPYSLLTAHHPLPTRTTHYSLLTTYYLRLTAYRRLGMEMLWPFSSRKLTVLHPGHFTLGLMLLGAGIKATHVRWQPTQTTVSNPLVRVPLVRVRVRVQIRFRVSVSVRVGVRVGVRVSVGVTGQT